MGSTEYANQNVSNMKRPIPYSNQNHLKRIPLFLLVFLLCISAAVAQTQISGTITNEDGEGMPGVSVVLKGTTDGSVTDLEGRYSFSSDLSGEQVLTISFVGYKSKTETVTLGNGAVTVDHQLALDLIGLEEVVVTGVVNPKSKLESSVSVTTLSSKTIAQSAPRTTAEIFRTIPGIKAEASAGDGNTNISVRGVPISAGGSRYLQLQEDGLPLLLYGDIAFSTQDQYLRADQNIDRIEAIRGGSSATTTSNGPAGIINFISKTGSVAGGGVGTAVGLNYNSIRTDFDYGSPIGNNTSFHVGGFFRQGEGPRQANHTVNLGGQFKANLTKYFDNGLARVSYKMLNDRTAAYMPMPLLVTGTNADPEWESVPGFDAVSNGLQSPYFQQNYGLGPDGNARNVALSDGIHSNSHAIGAYLEFDLPNEWTISSNSRMTFNQGRFVAPFTAEVGPTANIVDPILIGNGYTTGAGTPLPYALNRVAQGTTLADTDNGLLQRIHLFDVELENFNNFMSDTKLSRSFGTADVTLGVFKAYQNIQMSWLWNTYLMEVGENADLINISAGGDNITDNGLLNYGVPLWGNCCTGGYNTNYDVTAPYLSTSVQATDELIIDASLRYDYVRVRGTVSPSQQIDNLDVNGNGTIDVPERSVSRVDNNNSRIVRYDYDYVSYSVGANYKLSDANAVFARYSQGYVGNGERATWHQGGPYLDNGAPKNSLAQVELGYKKRFEKGGLFVTGFYSGTQEEAGVEATTQRVLSNDYRAFGVEVESNFRFNAFDFRSAITWVEAEITDNDGMVNIGNTPRRQPSLSYNLLPSYTIAGGHSIGISIIGQTKSYAQDNNELIMPGYAILNAYVTAQLSPGLTFTIDANNLTNTIGITEAEEGAITDNAVNYVRGRSVAGRSLVARLNLRF